jgi:hypothetical protein
LRRQALTLLSIAGYFAALIAGALIVAEGALFVVYWPGRGGEPSFDPRASRPRLAGDGRRMILMYGDSIVSAYGLDWTQGFPHLVKGLLDERTGTSAWRVRTSRGYCPSTYAETLRADLDALAPEAVVVELEPSNDVSDEALLAWDGVDADGLPTRVIGGRYLTTWDGSTTMLTAASSDRWFEHTRVFTIFRRAFGSIAYRLKPNPAFGPSADTYYYNALFDRHWLTTQKLDEGFDRMFRAIENIRHVCEKRGVKFLLMILPSSHWFQSGDRFQAGERRLLERAEAEARARGIAVVSPTPELAAAGGERLFIDFCHPTAEGHRVIADVLERALAASPARP